MTGAHIIRRFPINVCLLSKDIASIWINPQKFVNCIKHTEQEYLTNLFESLYGSQMSTTHVNVFQASKAPGAAEALSND